MPLRAHPSESSVRLKDEHRRLQLQLTHLVSPRSGKRLLVDLVIGRAKQAISIHTCVVDDKSTTFPERNFELSLGTDTTPIQTWLTSPAFSEKDSAIRKRCVSKYPSQLDHPLKVRLFLETKCDQQFYFQSSLYCLVPLDTPSASIKISLAQPSTSNFTLDGSQAIGQLMTVVGRSSCCCIITTIATFLRRCPKYRLQLPAWTCPSC